MRIQHNISALNTSQALAKNQKATQSNLSKLSSGYSINKAADNASGLAISEKMRGQIRGLTQAKKNATDGINLINTAEGYMSTANDILQRMRELAVQSANGTYDTKSVTASAANATTASTGDRAKINEEIQQLTDELDRLATTANFNGMKLSDKTYKFQVGADTGKSYTDSGISTHGASNLEAANDGGALTVRGSNTNVISVKIGGFDSTTLKVKAGNPTGTDPTGIDLTSQTSANKSIDIINNAISTVTAYRARLGAIQNRLEYTVNNLDTSIQNTTASESAVRDTDMVEEMMSFTKNNVLNQAATAMMAQANSQTQSVLQLLQ